MTIAIIMLYIILYDIIYKPVLYRDCYYYYYCYYYYPFADADERQRRVFSNQFNRTTRGKTIEMVKREIGFHKGRPKENIVYENTFFSSSSDVKTNHNVIFRSSEYFCKHNKRSTARTKE